MPLPPTKSLFVHAKSGEVMANPGPFLNAELIEVPVSCFARPEELERDPRFQRLAREIASNPERSEERMVAEVGMFVLSQPFADDVLGDRDVIWP